METIDESLELLSTSEQKEVEPEDLLDKYWFFHNLFNTSTKTASTITMPTSYSDSSSSSSSSNGPDRQEKLQPRKSLDETFSSIKKLTPLESGKSFRPAGLTRAPSLPEDSAHQRVRKSNLQKSSNSLMRAPSLPAPVVKEEIHDEESDFSMSKLIRQASLNQSDSLLPPRGSPKVVRQSSSTPRQRQRKNADQETLNTKSAEGVRRENQLCRISRLARSSSDLGFQQLKAFRDLSINYDQKGTEKEVSIQSQENIKEPSSAKAFQEQSFSTNQWGDKRSVEEDMKAQIKFWARAVASNVQC